MPTVAITGAAGAIGAVTAQVFADAGWTLGLIDYDAEAITALREAHPDAYVAQADLTNIDAARGAFDGMAEQHAAPDAVLAIAGGFAMQAATEATDADYARMMDINMRTLFNTARAALPHLQTHAEGFLLGVSAPAAENGAANTGLYAASKAAVAAYLKSLHAELHADGVRVSTLYPMGVVDTPANREAMPESDPATWIAPQELAETMLHAATRSARGHIQALKVYAAT